MGCNFREVAKGHDKYKHPQEVRGRPCEYQREEHIRAGCTLRAKAWRRDRVVLFEEQQVGSAAGAEWGRVRQEVRTKRESGGQVMGGLVAHGSGKPWLYSDMFFHSSGT